VTRLAIAKTGDSLVSGARTWIKSQYRTTQGGFQLSPDSPVCLIGTSCAALASETLDDLSSWSPDSIGKWSDFIQGFQREDGWFVDPYLEPSAGNSLDSDYLRGHATFLALMALDALEQKPRQPLEFLDAWRDDSRLYDWLEQRDWTNPWRESNWVEWIGYWLLTDAELRADDVPLPRSKWPAGFAGLMAWLEDRQDSTTGFWGDPPYTGLTRTLHMMAGAYHHYVFYYATGRQIRYQDRIIDHTLSLQQPDGLFVPDIPGGGPCEDLDAIDILANMHRLTDYRRNDIKSALTRALRALIANQYNSGAFVYSAKPSTTSLGSILKLSYSRGPRGGLRMLRRYFHSGSGSKQHYAGCASFPFHTGEGDMFSHWFRSLALAIIANLLGPDRAPVWWCFGFRRQITQGWLPGFYTERRPLVSVDLAL
jgi:hypothetical protein